MKLDSSSAAPAYAKVAAAIREAIDSGELRPGDQIPAGPKLASEFGVALMTVRRAIEGLRTEGVLESAQGVGVFVASPDRPPIDDLAVLRETVEKLTRRLEVVEKRLQASDGTQT